MTAPLTDFSDALIEQAIGKGMAEVVETMASSKIESLGRTPNPPLHSRPTGISGPHVVASVGFIGDISGLINMHLDDVIALELSAKMLGMSPAEVLESGVLADSMGELTNMIVGVFKNELGSGGLVCRLTLPTIIRGQDFHVDHPLKSARRAIFNFRCLGRAIVADIIIQLN